MSTKFDIFKVIAHRLEQMLKQGSFAQLPGKLIDIKRNIAKQRSFDNTINYIRTELTNLLNRMSGIVQTDTDSVDTTPEIVLSESFI